MSKKGEGLANRVAQFFRDNPQEELTFPMVCAKFDAKEATAYDVIGQMKREGLLETVYVIRPTRELRDKPATVLLMPIKR